MGFIDVPAAMKRADELLTQKDEVQKQIAGVRDALRTAVVDGDTTAEQSAWIEETFPKQATKTAEERVAAAEQRLQEVREKAAKQDGKGTRSRAKAAAAA